MRERLTAFADKLIAPWRRRGTRNRRNPGRLLRLEALEDRRLLSINWANKVNPAGFNTYGANEPLAIQIVQRAVDDWNRVILDQNYDNDANPATNDDFELTVESSDLKGARGSTSITSLSQDANHPTWDSGVPTSATITLDDDGGRGINDDNIGPGNGWFFDPTPYDDAEFTAIVNTGASGSGPAFQASFINTATGSQNYADFFRTITHEIGHALGIVFTAAQNSLITFVRNERPGEISANPGSCWLTGHRLGLLC